MVQNTSMTFILPDIASEIAKTKKIADSSRCFRLWDLGQLIGVASLMLWLKGSTRFLFFFCWERWLSSCYVKHGLLNISRPQIANQIFNIVVIWWWGNTVAKQPDIRLPQLNTETNNLASHTFESGSVTDPSGTSTFTSGVLFIY